MVDVSGDGGGKSRLRTVVLPLLLRASFSRRCVSFLFFSSSTSASPCVSVLLLLSAGGVGSDWDCGRWLGNQVAAAVMVVLRRFFFSVLCSSLCQQRPPLSVVAVLLTAHGAGGDRGTGGAVWPVVLLPFSALSSVSGLLCSSYLS